MNVEIEKGLELEIDITSSGSEGEGVGKIDGFTVFVKGAIVGERVRIEIIKKTKNYAVGRIIEVLSPSENRIDPVCGIYKRCGGCNLQHMTYGAQLEMKKKKVIDAIERIGKLQGVLVHDTLGMETPYRYRNKVQLPVGKEDEAVKIGFYAPRSHNIIDMTTCDIQDETADMVSSIVREWAKDNNISIYNEETNGGNLKHIMIRRGFKTNEVMVVIVSKEDRVKHTDKLVDMLVKSVPGITSIIQNINPNKTNVVLGKKCVTLWGADHITDYIGDLKFSISPLSFFQVNPVQTEVLYGKALEYAALTGEETVFDAYCGTGTISLFLAKKAKKVYGVEIVPEAIENAKENAKTNNIENAEFFVGEAEKIIPNMIKKGTKAEVIVVDPPRKGCGVELLEAITKIDAKRIVYVSCDCATLARDLKVLDGMGYKVVEVQPVDMFPQTAHVETVVLITRKEK